MKSISTCENSQPFCGSFENDPYIFPNTTGISNNTQVACLGSIPNPTFFTLEVTEPGVLKYSITQAASFDLLGNPVGQNNDVDFAVWGPFTNNESCNQISYTDCPTCPFDNSPPVNNTFYPLGNIVDCSYSISAIENFTIPNAQVGQFYKILITNFSNQPGFIKLLQTNFSNPLAGKTACGDKLLLNAFLDLNSNGLKDLGENNFSFGTFTYQVNNTGAFTNISSPYGRHSIYDPNPSNSYDVSYEIFPEFTAYYSLATPNFNDLVVALDSGTQVINFPVTIVQNYSDVSINEIPVGAAVAGAIYESKIVYKNQGTTPASGTLFFNKDPLTTIFNISQAGTIITATGFKYNYTNLAPFETKSIFVKMNIPPIPAVSLGNLLTNSVSITTTSTDVNAANNLASNSQIVIGSFDPNDKMESHGSKILFSNFSQNEYLTYTLRFQNTGTSNAINIRLEDVLDSKIDEQSVRVIDASHFYAMKRVGSELVFKFDNIQLVPSSQSIPLSNGYITFKVKLKPGFAIGDIIPNTASIYFDSNPAIITNTFNSEFVTTLANETFDASNFMIFPNPASNTIQISLQNTNEIIETLKIKDVLGKNILIELNSSSNQQIINVSDLAKGVYFVEISTKSKLKFTKRLIIE